MGRKKKLPLISNLEIIDFAAEGKSIARLDNMVIFVKNLVPGDIADVQITRHRRKYMEGIAVELKKRSEERTAPFCSHFGTCGGCKWQILDYKKQLIYKQREVSDNLQRIAKVPLPEINPIIASHRQQFYRNKLEYTFSANRWLNDEEVISGKEISDWRALGFHLPGKFDRVLNIVKCYLQSDFSNQIRNRIREFTLKNSYSYYNHRNNSGLMRNLIIRNSSLDEWMVIVIFAHDDKEKIQVLLDLIENEFPSITSLQYVINPKLNDTINDLDIRLFAGRDHIFEKLGGLKFKIGPKSFFQTNTEQALELYKVALRFADCKGDELVYDLYTGTGTIANFIASSCNKVIGIDTVQDAIDDARINSEINHIKNTIFNSGDSKDILNPEFISKYGRPDIIITDPPRNGMHPAVIEAIKVILPERIIYISCNPSTQARDIRLLSNSYTVKCIQPVDMFPHTHHVENVVRLDRI